MGRRAWIWMAAVVVSAVGCSTLFNRGDSTPAPVPQTVEIKTVQAPEDRVDEAGNPLPVPTLKVRPKRWEGTEAALAAGKKVGPIVTHAGAARADGRRTDPVGKTAEGWPIYRNFVGSGFIMVIEAKPGISNVAVGRSIFRYDPEDASKVPDLQILFDQPLGDGSTRVCDARRPNFGGIPAIRPSKFDDSAKFSAAINDVACRFEVFGESDSSCTMKSTGDFAFLNEEESTVQFCMVVAKKWNFTMGDTTVSIRVLDKEGNPGPVSKFILRREVRPTRPPYVPKTPTPTPVRRRP